jgi:5-methylcytosine-specific restriction enzyme A
VSAVEHFLAPASGRGPDGSARAVEAPCQARGEGALGASPAKTDEVAIEGMVRDMGRMEEPRRRYAGGEGVNRKTFFKKHKVTRNTDFSWSGVNHTERKVFFGAWVNEDKSVEDGTRIFSTEWIGGKDGKRKNPNYRESLRNLSFVVNSGYDLVTFPMYPKHPIGDKVRLDGIKEELTQCWLLASNRNEFTDYYAAPTDNIESSSKISAPENSFWEGSKYQVLMTGYERSDNARKQCLDFHGFVCAVCDFNFLHKYGDIGRDFIHVHHLVRMADRPTPYQINGADELRPVCPNCHAMLHKRIPPFGIEEMKEIILIASVGGKTP